MEEYSKPGGRGRQFERMYDINQQYCSLFYSIHSQSMNVCRPHNDHDKQSTTIDRVFSKNGRKKNRIRQHDSLQLHNVVDIPTWLTLLVKVHNFVLRPVQPTKDGTDFGSCWIVAKYTDVRRTVATGDGRSVDSTRLSVNMCVCDSRDLLNRNPQRCKTTHVVPVINPYGQTLEVG